MGTLIKLILRDYGNLHAEAIENKKRLGRYIPTGFVAAQLYVNPVLIFGFLFLSLMTCWPEISYLVMPLPAPEIFKLLEF